MTDPRPSLPVRRASDAYNIALLIVGALLMGAGVALKLMADASDMLVIVLVATGGVLIPGSRVLDAIRFWRRGNGAPQ